MKKKRSTLGTQLRHIRRALDLTLSEVSAKTGLSESYLSNLEAGKPNACNPSLNTIRQLTAVYGLNTSIWFS